MFCTWLFFLLGVCSGLYLVPAYATGGHVHGRSSDVIAYDRVYSCLVKYSDKVFSNLNSKDQVYEECSLYEQFKSCLSRNNDDAFIKLFIEKLNSSMNFCKCLIDLAEFLNMPRVNLETVNRIVCRLYEEQAKCLQGYFYSNPFIKYLLTDLRMKINSEYCDLGFRESWQASSTTFLSTSQTTGETRNLPR